jgi:hypothetical protein
MNTNTLRRLNWLWKHRHTHDDDNLAEQLTIIVSEVQQQVDSVGTAANGAYLHLARTATQSIAVDGEAIDFDQLGLLGHAGFGSASISDDGSSGGLTLGTDIVIPRTGYWDLKITAGWVSFKGGGSVWITRTRGGVETTIYPPTGMPAGVWSSDTGQVFTPELVKGIGCEAGDILKVWIDADDASDQDLASAVLEVELVDRAGPPALSLAYTETLHDSDTTSHALTLPAAGAGDRIILLFHATDVGGGPIDVTDWDGFTELSESRFDGDGEGSWVAELEATGAETTVTVTTDLSVTSAVVAIVVPQGGAPEVAAFVGSGNTPDPPELTHSSGGPRFVAIAAYSTDGPNSAPARQTTDHPDGYTMIQTVGSAVGSTDGATIGSAFRVAESATENPDTFTFDQDSDVWCAHTILVPYTGAT